MGQLKEVKSIILHANELSGELPAELGECKKLRMLLLFGNDFSGCLPEELGHCLKLSDLRIKPGNQGLISNSLEQLFEPSVNSKGQETLARRAPR